MEKTIKSCNECNLILGLFMKIEADSVFWPWYGTRPRQIFQGQDRMTDIFHARAKALGKDTEVYMAFAQLASSVFGARASLPFWTPFTLETFLSSWTSQQIQDSLNLTKASKVKALEYF